MRQLNLLVWMTQLGFSVAGPLVVCTLGAVWLRERFLLGSWVIVLGVALGAILAIDGFRSSLKIMVKMDKAEKQEANAPSCADHQELPGGNHGIS